MPRRLRVALDTTYAGVNQTGVGIYSRRIASGLNEADREGKLHARCYGPACDDNQRPAGVRAIAQEWPVNTHGLLPLRLRRFHPDVVHSTSHIGPLWLPHGKLVVTVHDLIFMHRPHDYNASWLVVTRLTLPLVLARGSAIIADSHATAGDIRRFYRVPRRKTRVVYPGVDQPPPGEGNTHGPPIVLPPAARYILCTGPWVRRKNLRVVVEAFGLLGQREANLHLVITGRGASGMKGETPEQLVSSLPETLRDRVHCLGFVERARLDSLIKHAAVLAYPSRIEGFGLPPLEAMSRGVPVVISDIPVLAEVSGDAALTANVGDSQGWSAAFERILHDTQLQKRLSSAGLSRSKDFTWERCVSETIAVYHEVAAARTAY